MKRSDGVVDDWYLNALLPFFETLNRSMFESTCDVHKYSNPSLVYISRKNLSARQVSWSPRQ